MAANGHGDVAAFENRQALTVAKFIDKRFKVYSIALRSRLLF